MKIEKRKEIHNYIENENPNIKKKSLKCKSISDYCDTYYNNCPECGEEMLLLDFYYYGIMENNMDESLSGECRKCSYTMNYEPNFSCSNNGFIVCPRNNIIAIGEYISNKKPNKILIDDYQYFIIDTPSKQLNKHKLGDYINEKIRKKIGDLIVICNLFHVR